MSNGAFAGGGDDIEEPTPAPHGPRVPDPARAILRRWYEWHERHDLLFDTLAGDPPRAEYAAIIADARRVLGDTQMSEHVDSTPRWTRDKSTFTPAELSTIRAALHTRIASLQQNQLDPSDPLLDVIKPAIQRCMDLYRKIEGEIGPSDGK